VADPAAAAEKEVLREDADGEANLADPKAANEVIQERYPSGKIKIRREVTTDQNGSYILHGAWSMWDEGGNLIGSGQYRNNQRYGTWTRTHSGKDAALFSEMPYKEFTAPFTSQATFQDGRLHGKWIISDSEGHKISEWQYANGVLHGLCIWYYPSGKVMKEVVFRNGLADGYLHQYDKESTLVLDEIYQEGQKLAPKIEHDKAGGKVSEGIYLYARNAVESPDDWWNAKPVKYMKVGEDVKHGCWTGWYPNGQKRVEGIYDHGVPSGQFTWWYPNGQQKLMGDYQKGKPHGAWTWWHENGQKATSGQYSSGEPAGAWTYWHESGQLSEKSDFSAAAESVVVGPTGQKDGNAPAAAVSQRPATGKATR
jgi:antitoxin component YwqK of YwqJK toxin-antitoxin module